MHLGTSVGMSLGKVRRESLEFECKRYRRDVMRGTVMEGRYPRSVRSSLDKSRNSVSILKSGGL